MLVTVEAQAGMLADGPAPRQTKHPLARDVALGYGFFWKDPPDTGEWPSFFLARESKVLASWQWARCFLWPRLSHVPPDPAVWRAIRQCQDADCVSSLRLRFRSPNEHFPVFEGTLSRIGVKADSKQFLLGHPLTRSFSTLPGCT